MTVINPFVEKYGLVKYETFKKYDIEAIKNYAERNEPLSDILLFKLLKYAFQFGEKEIIKELLPKISNISKRDKNGNNVLHYATENPNNKDIIEYIIKDLSNDEQKKEILFAKNGAGLTPLMIAVEKNDVENAQTLTIICKELNLPLDIFNIISLMNDENIPMFDFLLDKCGWKFNVFNKDGKAPLHVAIEENNIKLVRKLLENRANIEINEEIKMINENNEEVIKPGNTPLLTAVKFDNLEILKVLLEHKAEIDPKKVLLFMAKHNASKVFEYFYSSHPDTFSKMREYVTQCIDDDECDRALYKAEEHKTANTPLHHIAAKGNLQMFTVFIPYFHNVNVCNHHLRTPLHFAAKNGNDEIFKKIFDISKNSLYLKDLNEETPISLACKHNSVKIIDIILNSVDFEADKEKIKYFLKVAVETRCTILVKKLYTEPIYKYEDPIFQYYFKEFIKKGFTEGVNAVIIISPDWKTLLQRQLPSERNKGSESPIQLLIKYMPEKAEIAFDKYVTDKGDGEVEYDFKIINDFYYAESENRYYSEGREGDASANTEDAAQRSEGNEKSYVQIVENHPLSLMVKHRRNDLIFHPLTEAYIHAKWNKYTRWYYNILSVLYALMCIPVTLALLNMKLIVSFDDETNMIVAENVTLFSNITTTTEKYDAFLNTNFAKHCKKNLIIEWFLTGIGVFHLILTFYIPCKCCYTYMKTHTWWESIFRIIFVLCKNMLHIILGICCILCGYPMCIFLSDVVYFQLITTAVFLSPMCCFFSCDKNPRIGAFVIMIKNVLILVLKFFLPVLMIACAFVQIFHVYFETKRDMFSFLNSLLLILVMMTGEVNYKEAIAGRTLSLLIIFFMFFLLVIIVLMNLLTALAVADVTKTLGRGVLMLRIEQIEAIHNIEIGMLKKYREIRWKKYCEKTRTSEDSHCFTNPEVREFFNLFGLSKKTFRENFYDDVDVRRQRKLERDRNVAIEMEPLLP